MFDISLVLRISAALALLFAAIYFKSSNPDNPTVSLYVKSMVTWFIALGPLHWLDNYIYRLIENKHYTYDSDYKSAHKYRISSFLAVFTIISLFALYYLLRACSAS
ncbi:MAG: hypothetical protein HW384_2186 [Dehalococcoidia bacterium]|nr:hypothetical protein [Dehalococcoidia bacterium]